MSGIPSNTLVRVPGNWVPLSEIEIGDTVISADGSLSKVLAVYDTGMQPVYRFTFTDGRQCDTSADYVWDLEEFVGTYRKKGKFRRKFKYSYDLVRDVNAHGRISYYTSFPSAEISSDANLPLDPYFLGVLLGSGFIKPQRIGFTGDNFMWNTLKSLIPEYCKLSLPRIDEHERLHVDVLHNKEYPENKLPKILTDLGLMDLDMRDKFIPRQYLNASHTQRISLLQGILDSYGKVGDYSRKVKTMTDNSMAEYKTFSMEFCDNLIYLVRSLGGLCTDTQRYSKYTKFGEEKGMNYTIQMSLEFSKMFFRTPDKRDLLPKYNPMLKHWALKMVCCTPLPIKYPCRNLLLENRDNRFVTDKFIVMTGHTCL